LSLRTASGSNVRSILVLALDTDPSVVGYTTFSAACQSRAYCRMCGGWSGSVWAVS
jgi:hypothetical protein